jgi:HD-like signal output (HDOD) protein
MKRILFVDDEENILNGLKRMLRPMRNEWEVEFALSAEAALELMEQQAFHVVVSDMRMPKHDGAYLLNAVRERYPDVARIILSGHAEQEMSIRSVAATHQFLAKPCDAETLRRTVERTCRLRDMMRSERLRGLISQIGQLPSVPEIFEEMSAEMGSEEPSLRNVAAIVARDIAMSAKILQLVNSAFFGLRRKVGSVEQAVSYLGMDVIRSLVLSQSAFRSLERGESAVAAGTLWRFGQAVAAVARMIVKDAGGNRVMIDEAFQASMMIGLGKLILASSLPDEYASVVERVAAGEAEADVERELFDATHGEVGGYLLGLWGLSDGIVEALAYYAAPGDMPVTDMQPVVAVHSAAAIVSEQQGDGTAIADTAWLERAGFADHLERWRQQAAELNTDKDAA